MCCISMKVSHRFRNKCWTRCPLQLTRRRSEASRSLSVRAGTFGVLCPLRLFNPSSSSKHHQLEENKYKNVVEALVHVANTDDSDDYSIITIVAMACDAIGSPLERHMQWVCMASNICTTNPIVERSYICGLQVSGCSNTHMGLHTMSMLVNS